MNKRKLLTLALTLCMIAILAIGGTLAYFTDTAKELNTMVIGNVQITIDEWKYEDGAWTQYDNADPFVLYPIENEQGAYLYNKSVRTYNTSPSGDDVYMRSIILVEANAQADATGCCFPGIHVAYDTNDNYVSSYDKTTHNGVKPEVKLADTVTVDGKEYNVITFVEAEEKAIPAGHALSSLHSVYMDENVDNETAAVWGDDGVQIIAFTQAIQATGLTHAEAMEALGEVTVTNVEAWLAAE